MTSKDFLDFAMKHKAETDGLKFVDLLGTWQHCSYTIDLWDGDTFNEGFGFDVSSIRDWQDIHKSDMLAVHDPSTAKPDPFFCEECMEFEPHRSAQPILKGFMKTYV